MVELVHPGFTLPKSVLAQRRGQSKSWRKPAAVRSHMVKEALNAALTVQRASCLCLTLLGDTLCDESNWKQYSMI